MIENNVREYLIDFQRKDIPPLIDRELNITLSGKIISIIGPRRAGKTYYFYQKIGELLQSGIPKESIIYLNFEDPRLIDISFQEIREIIKLHWRLYPASMEKPLQIFMDEPQNIPKWEVAVRALHDEGFIIFLTGSSSKLLSKEIATALRGRTVPFLLLPCSFKEFLRLKDIVFDKERLSSKDMALLLSLLDEYLNYGGFPEIVKEQNEDNKTRIFQEYFNTILYRDVVERYKIRNTNLIKWLIRSLASSFAKEFSIHKIFSTLISQGLKASKNTLYAYVSMLEDVLFIFPIPKFSYSIRKRELSVSKIYLCDIGFSKIVEAGTDIGKKIENVVFLELVRKKSVLSEICYWKNSQKEEVDFVLRQGNSAEKLIQVCYNIDDPDTKKRELRALLKGAEELNCNDLSVITWNYEASETINNKTIAFIPLWKWLLN
jgi:predicted AAA+ superfamily ATPase